MNPAGTQLSALDADTPKPRPQAVASEEGPDMPAGDGAEASGASYGSAIQHLAPVTATAAIAVAQPVAAPDLALVPPAAPIAVGSLDLSALEQIFADFDSDLSTVVRLSLKRAFDILASATALLLLSPVLLLIAALIKLGDGGPVLFVQRRVGLRGRTFRMLKFRSMVIHAERLRPKLEICNESSGPVFKMRLDPRVTAIGRFVRRYSLDELPQLLNVLRGDMSIVGPRPSLPSEAAHYEQWQYRRFSVRPGLTCLWQVDPRRYQVSFDEWMQLDLTYVDRWNLRLDLALMLRTFRVVFAGTGR